MHSLGMASWQRCLPFITILHLLMYTDAYSNAMYAEQVICTVPYLANLLLVSKKKQGRLKAQVCRLTDIPMQRLLSGAEWLYAAWLFHERSACVAADLCRRMQKKCKLENLHAQTMHVPETVPFCTLSTNCCGNRVQCSLEFWW